MVYVVGRVELAKPIGVNLR